MLHCPNCGGELTAYDYEVECEGDRIYPRLLVKCRICGKEYEQKYEPGEIVERGGDES